MSRNSDLQLVFNISLFQLMSVLALSLAQFLFLQQSAQASLLNFGTSTCPANAIVHQDSSISVRADKNFVQRVNFGPAFFGFNLEWLGFQEAYWDASTRKVKPEIIEWLQPFSGAIYRYPGGTVANYFNWQDSVGPLDKRLPRKIVDWKGPFVTDFGFDEYLTFTQQVAGVPWVVANLYGVFGHENDPAEMAKQNGAWAAYARNKLTGATGIFRWELGNELDRSGFDWPPQKYGDIAKINATVISNNNSNAKFVALLEDFDAYPGMKAAEYDRTVIEHLPSTINEFALHSYYDGKPGGPPIPNRLQQVCKTVSIIRSVRPNTQAKIWITEHARWPTGETTDKDWKRQWWKTTNLEAALGMGDFIIGLTQVPEVQGAMLHALGGATGPWPLFQRQTQTGMLYPSAVYWALRTLREGMLDTVLQTTTNSTNESGYPGGYDVRAVVMMDHTGAKYGLWMVNRANTPQKLNIALPQLAGKTFQAQLSFVGGMNKDATNTDDNMQRVTQQKSSYKLNFDVSGNAIIALPPNSVSSLQLTK